MLVKLIGAHRAASNLKNHIGKGRGAMRRGWGGYSECEGEQHTHAISLGDFRPALFSSSSSSSSLSLSLLLLLLLLFRSYQFLLKKTKMKEGLFFSFPLPLFYSVSACRFFALHPQFLFFTPISFSSTPQNLLTSCKSLVSGNEDNK